MAGAAYNAVSTLAFVASDDALPRILDRVRSDLNADEVNSLTELDLGVWDTPEGKTYVDGGCRCILNVILT